MRTARGAGLFLVGVVSCAEPIPIVYPPAPPPAPVAAAPPPAPEPPPPPPVPWGLVYERSCNASITAPVPALDGASVALCGSLYAAERGRFLGRAPDNLVAFLAGGRGLVRNYDGGGVSVVEPGGASPARAGEAFAQAVAVSPDGARVVSLEAGAGLDGDRLLVVREVAPSLREIRRTNLGHGPSHQAVVGFLADGREAFLGADHCAIEDCTEPADRRRDPRASCLRPRCPEANLLVVEAGKAAPLSPALAGVTAIAFASAGDAALVARADGAMTVVALPSAHEIAPVPWPKDREISALAIARGGDRVAVAGDGRVVVYARAGSAFVPASTFERGLTASLAFAPDGRTLYAGNTLGAYREGATPKAAAPVVYAVTPPPGSARLARDGVSFVHDGGSALAPLGAVAMFRDEKHGAEVTVVADDASAYDPASDAASWARAVAAQQIPHLRFEPGQGKGGPRLAVWGEPGARGALIQYTGDGCDPHDEHIRLQEREGRLWIVTLSTAPGLTGKRLDAWRAAFMDAPLGAPPASATAASPAAKKRAKRKGKR